MYLYINTLKQRLDAINQLRLKRASSSMNESFSHAYRLLPVLLNYHHPILPGYVEGNVPFGVCFFAPDVQQTNWLKQFEPHVFCQLSLQKTNGKLPITGIYSMGSTASIGQNNVSDLDIWVCHQSWLDQEERKLLQKKCILIKKWAASFSINVTFFLIDENRFRYHISGSLNSEDCGTTQHILLLDEFYRTAVRIAGKRLLWMMVPTKEETNYDEYVLFLYAQRVLTPNEWLDLGGLGELSAKEYFGASLWQLYKSVDSPYKAVLKSTLLESYSRNYPHSMLLAMEFKQRFHAGKIDSYGLDAYCLMLERVTRYLLEIGDFKRLDLIRRCFYLKVCEKLRDKNHIPTSNSWQKHVLSKIVTSWEWNAARLSILNKRNFWKIEQVRDAHNELLDTLMESYCNLIRFARRNNLQVSASSEDIGVLTRKLYAAFEILPGKVTLVNSQISLDLSENHLTFIYVPAGRRNHSGWYLYNKAPKIDSIIGHKHLEHNHYLSKIVAWTYFNGLLTAQSHIYIHNGGSQCDKNKLHQFINDITTNFPISLLEPTPQALYSPCEIRHLAIIVNLEKDLTAVFSDQIIHFNLCDLEILSFGDPPQCLVSSVDLLYRNSWNEIRTLHFSGEQSMLEALKAILCKMHQDAKLPDTVKVFCYSQNMRGLIRACVQQLVSECIELRLSSSCNNSGRFKALRIAGQTWGLFFERLNVSVQKLENAVEFYGAISNNKLHGLPIKLDIKETYHLPLVVNSYASEGIVQFFFEDIEENHSFNIYILDEKNRAEIYSHCEGNKEKLVMDVNCFYSSSHYRYTYRAKLINFNLPQFYQIIKVKNKNKVIPYLSGSLSNLQFNENICRKNSYISFYVP